MVALSARDALLGDEVALGDDPRLSDLEAGPAERLASEAGTDLTLGGRESSSQPSRMSDGVRSSVFPVSSGVSSSLSLAMSVAFSSLWLCTKGAQ